MCGGEYKMNNVLHRQALVIAVEPHHVTLLLPGGQFKRVRMLRHHLEVGQEYRLPEHSPWQRALWGVAAAVGALALLLTNGPQSPTPLKATAVVSLDMNSSMSMVVAGPNHIVVSASGKDARGRRVLSQIPITGLPIVRAVADLTRQARKDGYLNAHHPFVVLAAAFGVQRQTWFAQVQTTERHLLQQNGLWQGRLVVVSAVSHSSLTAIARQPSSVGRTLLWSEVQGAKHHVPWASPVPMSKPLQSLVEPILHNHRHKLGHPLEEPVAPGIRVKAPVSSALFTRHSAIRQHIVPIVPKPAPAAAVTGHALPPGWIHRPLSRGHFALHPLAHIQGYAKWKR